MQDPIGLLDLPEADRLDAILGQLMPQSVRAARPVPRCSLGEFLTSVNWKNKAPVARSVERPAAARLSVAELTVSGFFKTVNWTNAAPVVSAGPPPGDEVNLFAIEKVMAGFVWD